MQITLNQDEIEESIKTYVLNQLAIRDDQEISVDFRAGRGENGFTATLDIRPRSKGPFRGPRLVDDGEPVTESAPEPDVDAESEVKEILAATGPTPKAAAKKAEAEAPKKTASKSIFSAPKTTAKGDPEKTAEPAEEVKQADEQAPTDAASSEDSPEETTKETQSGTETEEPDREEVAEEAPAEARKSIFAFGPKK